MAAEAGKPIVLFPRRASLGETTTDHQLHTAGWLKDRPGVFLAEDENALDAQISLANARTMSGDALSTVAPAPFVAKLREALVN